MKALPKPTVEEILEQVELCETHYSTLFEKFKLDEEFYELEFSDRLDIPVEYKASAIVLPTGRDDVDTFLDHIDLTNARVFANKKGTRKMDAEEAEMMRKFYLGVLYANAVRADISPLRVGGKHYALHGLCVIGSFWDADMWSDKPRQGDTESEEEYAERLDKWRAETHMSIPIVLRAVNPANILPDPGYGGRLYVIERREKTAFEVKRQWPHWKGALGGNGNTPITCLSYWDKDYRCELVENEPVLKTATGIVKHGYGFLPYTLIESGLGNMAKDNASEKRYVGILRYIYELLVSESRSYSLNDVVLAKTALPWGVIERDPGTSASIPDIVQHFGTYTELPPGVHLRDMVPQTPPAALRTHLAITADYIAAHAAPRSLRGLSEEGVRSRVDRDRVIAEASAKYQYSTEAFRNGVAQVLIKCALLYKNKIPGDLRVWARTPTDEFDVEVDKKKMREPFSCYVEFAPFSEEDEYRRHIDLEQQVKSGLVTKSWARRQMSNVDAVAMEKEELKESLKQSPVVQQLLQQYLAGRLAAALSKRSTADVVSGVTPAPPSQPPAQPPQSPGRPLVPTVQQVPGQAESIGGEMAKTRQGMMPYTGQGEGGGGNLP